MNLVVGSTGLTGLETCRRLLAAGHPVRALVRSTSDPARVGELERLGAELAVGDLKDRPSLDAACRGVRCVVSTATVTSSRVEGDSIRTVDRDGHRALIDAAAAAGGERFVFVSFRHQGVDYPLARAKRAVEEALKRSGLVYCSLQASWFNEVWLTPRLGFDYPNARARIYGSGENKISWISYVDVARFAAACVDHPAAEDAILELGGPEPLSPLDVVRIFEDVGGRPFEVEHVPEEALQAQRAAAADPLAQSAAGAMLHYAGGDEIDMRRTLATFPIELATVRDYARQVLGRDRPEGPPR